MSRFKDMVILDCSTIVLDRLHFPDLDILSTLLYPALCLQEADLCGLHLFGSLAVWFLLGFGWQASPAKAQKEGERDRDYFYPARSWFDSDRIPQSNATAPVGWTSPGSCNFPPPLRGHRHCSSTLVFLAQEGFAIPCWFPSTLPSPLYIFPSLNSVHLVWMPPVCHLNPAKSYDQGIQGSKEDYSVYTIIRFRLLKPYPPVGTKESQ